MDIITAEEAGDILSCTAATIRNMILRNELPIVRKTPGRTGAYLIDRAEVEKLLDSKTA
jgi:excisionase family DNA binding protein